MRWKDLQLKYKFFVVFGSLIFLLLTLAGSPISGIRDIITDAEEVIDGNALRAFLIQKEVDHYEWAKTLNRIVSKNDKSIVIQSDLHKCSFGQWYYREGRQKAEKNCACNKTRVDINRRTQKQPTFTYA